LPHYTFSPTSTEKALLKASVDKRLGNSPYFEGSDGVLCQEEMSSPLTVASSSFPSEKGTRRPRTAQAEPDPSVQVIVNQINSVSRIVKLYLGSA
jgi:hypothetical protein